MSRLPLWAPGTQSSGGLGKKVRNSLRVDTPGQGMCTLVWWWVGRQLHL